MRIKWLANITFLIIVVIASCSSASAAWSVLKANDVEKFIDTFPGMYQEYKALGLNINSQTGKVSGADKLKRDKEVQRILQENGWNFMFWPKLQAITRGYSLLKYEKVHNEHGANIDKFFKDLKKAQWLTPEKKAEIEKAYSQAKKGLAAEAERRRKQVHKKDLAILNNYVPELDSVLQKIVRVQLQQQKLENSKAGKCKITLNFNTGKETVRDRFQFYYLWDANKTTSKAIEGDYFMAYIVHTR